MTQNKKVLLSLSEITKAYPGVVANRQVDLTIHQGEVHALLGENGAGKSTLVKMIYGLVKPDQGSMVLDGKVFAPSKPSEARRAGLGMVFQHFTLFEAMTVAENIAVGMEEPPAMEALENHISELSNNYGLPIQPTRLIADLSAGERQRVEIIRCLLQKPRLLIMDEPTSVLTPQEVEVLFTTLKKLSAEGTAILYISHKLNEIKTLCEAATILRGGKVVGCCDPKKETAQSMAEMMVGTDLAMPTDVATALGDAVFVANHLSLASSTAFGTSLKDICFELCKGSILGVGGVAGNGQDELLAVLSGEKRTAKQSLWLKDQDISRATPNQRRKLGLLSAPEERLGHAAAPSMPLVENVFLTARIRKALTHWGFLKSQTAAEFTDEVIQQFDVRTPSRLTEAGSLSGGNLQKFVIGREVLQAPEIFVVNQPTWGVDAAAAAAIRHSLKQLTQKGAAVIVISQDLDELLTLADHFAVLAEGELSAVKPTSDWSANEIGIMMGGQINHQQAGGVNATT